MSRAQNNTSNGGLTASGRRSRAGQYQRNQRYPQAVSTLTQNGNWQANGGNQGRALFTPANMIQNTGGVYNNFHGLQSATQSATQLDNPAIDELINQWNPSPDFGCPATVKQDLRNMLQIIRDSQLNFTDFYAVMRTVQNVLSEQGVNIIVPTRSTNRGAGLQFTEEPPVATRRNGNAVRRTTSIRKPRDNPSFLWAIVTNNCSQLDTINGVLDEVLRGGFARNTQNVPNYAGYRSSASSQYNNEEVTAFWQAIVGQNPECQGVDQGYVTRLLDDIDALKMNGQDVFAFVREFSVQAGGPVLNESYFRAGTGNKRNTNNKFSLAQQVPPSGRRIAGATGNRSKTDRAKASLLWYIASNYCQDLPLIVAHLEEAFAVQPLVGAQAINLQAVPRSRAKSQSSQSRQSSGQQNQQQSGGQQQNQQSNQQSFGQQSQQSNQQSFPQNQQQSFPQNQQQSFPQNQQQSFPQNQQQSLSQNQVSTIGQRASRATVRNQSQLGGQNTILPPPPTGDRRGNITGGSSVFNTQSYNAAAASIQPQYNSGASRQFNSAVGQQASPYGQGTTYGQGQGYSGRT